MASIKDTYPIKFNTTEIPFYPTWSRAIEKIEDVKTSEGGTQIVQTIHVGRRSYPFTIAVAGDAWLETFEQFYEMDSFTLSIYSPRLHGYEERTVRMVNYNCAPRKKSLELDSVAGVWDVSFTLEAFT